MNALKELKFVIELDKITSIIHSSSKGDLEYSIPETFKLLEATHLQDVPEELSFNGENFKVVVSIDSDGFKNFSYISFKKKKTIKVVPEVLEPQYWSEKLQRTLPFKDEDYLGKERLEAKERLQDAIEDVEYKRSKLKKSIEEYYNKETIVPELFSIFEESGNFYIVLPKGIEFSNSAAIFNNPDYSSYKLVNLPKNILDAVDYSGYAIFEKEKKPLRIFGGATYDFSLSKYEKANPELAEVTQIYLDEYTKAHRDLIDSDFVFPVLGISWSNALNFDSSTKELAQMTVEDLKKLF